MSTPHKQFSEYTLCQHNLFQTNNGKLKIAVVSWWMFWNEYHVLGDKRTRLLSFTRSQGRLNKCLWCAIIKREKVAWPWLQGYEVIFILSWGFLLLFFKLMINSSYNLATVPHNYSFLKKCISFYKVITSHVSV